MDKHNVIVDIGYLILDIDELWITMIKSVADIHNSIMHTMYL